MSYCKISLKKLTGKSKYPDYNDSEFRKLFGSLKVSPELPFSRKEFFQAGPVMSQGMSISGVQQKLSLKINKTNTLEMTQQGGEYILKPSPEAFPNAAENEHCAMVSAQLLGIQSAPCGIVMFSDGEPAYITKRFDRQKNNKLHQEDMAQCLGLQSNEKYSHSYEEVGNVLNTVTRGKAAVLMDFYKRIVHAYIIGNDDMHLKNISVLKLPDNTGLYYDQLTPLYDVLFTEALVETNTNSSGVFALDLFKHETDGEFTENYEKYGFYTNKDFLEFGIVLGLKEKPVNAFLMRVVQKKPELTDLIARSYMPDTMKGKAVKVIEQRIKALTIAHL